MYHITFSTPQTSCCDYLTSDTPNKSAFILLIYCLMLSNLTHFNRDCTFHATILFNVFILFSSLLTEIRLGGLFYHRIVLLGILIKSGLLILGISRGSLVQWCRSSFNCVDHPIGSSEIRVRQFLTPRARVWPTFSRSSALR